MHTRASADRPAGTRALRHWPLVPWETLAEARHEVCSLVPSMSRPEIITHEDNLEAAEREAMKRGVTMRAVVERGVLEGPGAVASVGGFVRDGQQIAVVEKLPIKLVLADQRVALLPLDPERNDGEPVSIAVHRGGPSRSTRTLRSCRIATRHLSCGGC